MAHSAQPTPAAPVVVTVRGLRKITSPEAVGQVQEAANADTTATALERATAAAAIGEVLRQLERVEREADGLVLTSPQHGPASRLQSLIASGEQADLMSLEPLPTGGLEAKFDTSDWLGWAQVAWAKLRNPSKHPLARPASTVPDAIPDVARVGIVGDWGTGMYGAPEIARAIRDDADPFAVLLHLGDVYYSGTSREMRERFLDLWPRRPEAVSRGLNSNHDMYSAGMPYFTQTLPAFNQTSSYFALQNQHFTLIGLDVAYVDHDIDDTQAKWVEDVIAQAGTRKVIFFSHHQLYSHFEGQGTKLWQQPRFGNILRSRRVFAWYWGHEHRCSIFEAPDASFGILGRCIGHGGMPQSRSATRHLPRDARPEFSRAEWKRSAACVREGNQLSDVTVLDGENPLIPGEEAKFTPHGYAVLTLDGARLIEEVRDPSGAVIYERVLV